MHKELISMGIDIGTTTTQVIFSNIVIANTAGAFSVPDIKIIDKEIVFKSKIHFTPLLSKDKIDTSGVKSILSEEFHRSGISPTNVSTGAIIITGETARKENAREVLKDLEVSAGNFVVATAGPDLEAILAGWGSGTGNISKEIAGNLINFDIGGGTTNAVIFNKGEVLDSFALDIGGRLIKFDDEMKITYISERIKPLIDKYNFNIVQGQIAIFPELKKLTDKLSHMFLETMALKELTSDTVGLFIGHLNKGIKADFVSFSGGVAEFIYNSMVVDSIDKMAKYHDIGPLLGYSIRNNVLKHCRSLIKPDEPIRATVIGAGNYAIEVSGSTVITCDEILPLKNIPVIKLYGKSNMVTLYEQIIEKMRIYYNEPIAIAFEGPQNPGYEQIKDMATQITNALKDRAQPIIVIVERDFAKALGQKISSILGGKKPVISLDKIRVNEGCYIDIGKSISGVVPIVVKTLIF